jgi:hypothetical protein
VLDKLVLENVGPAPRMALDPLAPRLNLITGDNGLGKSFLLDIAWFALTRRWPADVNPRLTSGVMARPRNRGAASIEFAFTSRMKPVLYKSEYRAKEQAWVGKAGRPPSPGLVLYAMADGSYAVWDPARNYWRTQGGVDVQDRLPAYVFSPLEVWDGLQEESTTACNGLVRDWAMWQKENGETFGLMRLVLSNLSAASGEPLVPGALLRISIDDVRDIPSIHMPYGIDVPILHSSSAVRRIVALAYLMVWSWQEHRRASELLGTPPTDQVILLIDEIEAHLHPRWQRAIVEPLLIAANALTAGAQVQVIASTHSPLVLASAEPLFDDDNDAWFDIDLVRDADPPSVVLRKRPWVRMGDASNWLMSEAFDLGEARSVEAERVLKKTSAALTDGGFDVTRARELQDELRRVLPDDDPFWMRWRYVGQRRGWLP